MEEVPPLAAHVVVGDGELAGRAGEHVGTRLDRAVHYAPVAGCKAALPGHKLSEQCAVLVSRRIQNRPRIDAIFSAPSVEAILERLERDGSAFALATLHQLRAMSPSALKFTFRAIRAGAGLPLRDCLAMEYRVAWRAIQAPDFAEGVRAQLVDKDRAPRWRPERLAALPDTAIDAYFAPMDDLSFG